MRRILLCFRRKRRFAGLGMCVGGGSDRDAAERSTIPRKAFSPGNRIPVYERSEGGISHQSRPFLS